MKGFIMYYNCDCAPTFLVTSITNNGGVNYILNFRTTPTLANGECIKFRFADLAVALTAGLPIFANVNVNGVLTSVPLFDAIGNTIRTGDDLRIRTTYKAVFGADPNHLQVVEVKGCKCSKV